MNRPIINLADLEFRAWGRGAEVPGAGQAPEQYEARIAMVGAKVGAQKLGYNITSVPPGKRAFPFHNHNVNEEMFFVLEGEGELRFGPHRHPIKKGDFIACPPGGPEKAHQIVNTSQAELRYLAVSTKLTPEICEYPDTGKFGLLGELSPSPNGAARPLRYVGRTDASLPYWDGE